MTKLSTKNKFNRTTYKILKKQLFKHDPEKIHNHFTKLGKILGSNYLTKKTISSLFNYQNPILEQKILGINFKNPVGLSAGFDKNAQMIPIMENVGFGFVEIGSITAKPCKGNTGIRLKRIPEKESLWVNYGLNNQGAKSIKKKLENKKFNIPLGISIAKTNCKETADPKVGVKDYKQGAKIMKNIGDFMVLNISCPNAYGGRPFSSSKLYKSLVSEIEKLKIKKPVFVKLSPDLTKKEINQIIKISGKHKIDGFICTNLTKKGNKIPGSLSGKFVKEKSDKLLAHVYKQTRKTKNKYILIGSGGIASTSDAYKKIKLGASLVQLITGMIYHGPGLISEINRGLVQLLKKDGYKNISEAIGTAHKIKK